MNSENEKEENVPAKKIKRGAIPDVTIHYLDKNKEKQEGHFNHVCFAGLREKNRNTQYLSYKVRNHVTEAQALRYLKYCFDSFPFMRCLEEKTPQEILKDGATVNIHLQPMAKIFSAWTAVRYIEEYPEVLEWWDQALKMGIHEDMAFVMAHAYTKITIYDNLGGHGLMAGYNMDRTQFHNYNPTTNEKFKTFLDDQNEPFVKERTFFGVQNMFSKCFGLKGAKW